MAKTSVQIQARDRARAARAKADASRVERDKRIEQAQVDYFTATAEREQLVDQLAAIDGRLSSAVDRIASEGEDNDRIAALLDADVATVRRLRREAKTTAASTADTGSEPLGEQG